MTSGHIVAKSKSLASQQPDPYAVLRDQSAEVQSLRISPDEDLVLTGCADPRFQLWRTQV